MKSSRASISPSSILIAWFVKWKFEGISSVICIALDCILSSVSSKERYSTVPFLDGKPSMLSPLATAMQRLSVKKDLPAFGAPARSVSPTGRIEEIICSLWSICLFISVSPSTVLKRFIPMSSSLIRFCSSSKSNESNICLSSKFRFVYHLHLLSGFLLSIFAAGIEKAECEIFLPHLEA